MNSSADIPAQTVTDGEKKLLLLDGHSLAFRAFYALPAENFSTTGGQSTNAVYGFLSMLLGLLEQEKPTHVAAAFDLSGPTFREEKFPAYKAQRPAFPEEFKGQIELIRTSLETLGIKTLDKESYEADDIIATLATNGEKEGMDNSICTGDRDSLQLVTDETTVLYTIKGVSNLHRFTPAAVEEKYGVTPQQYPDLAALRGDTSDNMPGVPGVGPKTAEKWIQEYGSLAGVFAHKDDIKGKVGESLRENVDNVQLNRDLTEMVRDLDLGVSMDDLKPVQADPEKVLELFESLQFGVNLRNRVFKVLGIDFDDSQNARPVIVDKIKPDGLTQWLAQSSGFKTGRDLTDLTPYKPLTLAVAGYGGPDAGEAFALSILNDDYHGIVLDLADLSEKDSAVLAAWLADPASEKWTHDGKAVFHWLQGSGYELRGIGQDTALAAYLIRPDVKSQDLNDLLTRHLGRELPKSAREDLDDQAGQLMPDWTPLSEVAGAIKELVGALNQELDSIQGLELYEDMEVPLEEYLGYMERAGISVEGVSLEELSLHFEKLADSEVRSARELAGDPKLNLSSPKQLQVVLFDTLDMPKTKKIKTGYSTAAKELETLQREHPHPFLDHLMGYREDTKMKTTIDGLIKAVHADGRIHSTFNQRVAATGRLSSVDPNLQNIPVRTEAGREIRKAFHTGDGYATLITADYSQIEMRVMAHLSQDEGLIEAYKSGEDLHNYVGSKVFNVPVDEVTPELRRRVKAMSYGLVYGLSAFGLSQQLNISPGEAKKIMETYFERFGGVKKYLDEVVQNAKQTGYTETLFGRRRYLPELNSSNRVARENAERAALNAPIQGSAADIIKIAMIKVARALQGQNLESRIILQVHDELVLEVKEGEQERVTELLKKNMDAAADLLVPLEVSVGQGYNWDDAAH